MWMEGSSWKKWHLNRILKINNLVKGWKEIAKPLNIRPLMKTQAELKHSACWRAGWGQVQKWTWDRKDKQIQVVKGFRCYVSGNKDNPFKDVKWGRDVLECIFQKGGFRDSVEKKKMEGIGWRQDGQLGHCYGISRDKMCRLEQNTDIWRKTCMS